MPKVPIVPSIWIILGPILLIAAFAVLLPLLVRTGPRPPDEAWRGVFYSNPDDPVLLVPKRFGIGYTLNFGNPRCWIVIALMILMLTLPLIITAISWRHLPR